LGVTDPIPEDSNRRVDVREVCMGHHTAGRHALSTALLSTLALLGAACGSTGGGGGGGGATGCVPNATQQCFCSPGVPGVQACNAAGTGFSVCNCGQGGDTAATDAGGDGFGAPGDGGGAGGGDSGGGGGGDSSGGAVDSGGGAVDAGGPKTDTGGGTSDSCAGKCGKYDAKAACQCDDLCTGEGDCCADYKALCGGGDKTCGGKTCGPCQKCAGSVCVTDTTMNKKPCPGGFICYGSVCGCYPKFKTKCVGGDIWWYNSCNVKGPFKEKCEYGCQSNKCKPSPCGKVKCPICTKCNPYNKKCEGDLAQVGKVCMVDGFCEETGQCARISAQPSKGVWSKTAPSKMNMKGCVCEANAKNYLCGADYMGRWLSKTQYTAQMEFRRSYAPYYPTKDTKYWIVRTNISPKKTAFCHQLNLYPTIKSGIWKKNYPLKLTIPVWPSKSAFLAQECGTDYRGIMIITEGSKGAKERYQFEVLTWVKYCSKTY